MKKINYSEITPEKIYRNRRIFLKSLGLSAGSLAISSVPYLNNASAKNRDEAYVLSRYIIEEIKKRSPIWKKEHYENDESEWLKGNPIANEKI